MREIIYRNRHAIPFFIFGLIVLIINGVGYYFTFVYLNPPIEIYHQPFTVDKEVYRPGEPVILTNFSACQHADLLVDVVIEFRGDDNIYPMPTQFERQELTKGCLGIDTPISTSALTIPQDEYWSNPPDGTYFIKGKFIYYLPYKVNRTVEWHTVEFELKRD